MKTPLPYRHDKQFIKHPAMYLSLVKNDDVKANIKALWNMPYEADEILEPEFVGLTYGQVILFQQIKTAVRGDGQATDRILDRMIGRPEQVNKNLNVSGTYAEWLDQIAKQEGIIDADFNTTENK